jgi:hypothetical protein
VNHRFVLVAVVALAAVSSTGCGSGTGDASARRPARTTAQPTSTKETSTTASAPPRVPAPTTTSVKTARPESVRLPSFDASAGVPASSVTGVGLVGDAERGCVWVVLSDGTRRAALWPEGTSAKFRPTRVYDSSGALMWSEGELRDIGGGWSRGSVSERVPAQCRTEDNVEFVASVGSTSAH